MASDPVSPTVREWRRDLFLAAAGFVGWGAFASQRVPDMRHEAWAHALLLFAALVIFPLANRLAAAGSDPAWLQKLWSTAAWWRTVAAVLLAASYQQPPGTTALLLALPWAGFLGVLAVTGALRLAVGTWRAPMALCRDAGLVFAAIGAAWLLADRLALQPLGFSTAIVMLTAVHFHFAGILLPLVASRALAFIRGSWLAWWIVAGVPLVAVGITVTQLGGPRVLEMCTAWFMAIGGLAVASVHLQLARQPSFRRAARIGWMIAGISLALGMMLAALYGSRGLLPVPLWIDIPWMRAFHGSLNAIGFALVAPWAWRLADLAVAEGGVGEDGSK